MDMYDNLHWLGHSSFRWEGSKVVYFDPYHISSSDKKADIIFVSHEHFDHCSKEDISRISGKDTVIITSSGAAGQLKKTKAAWKELKTMAPGDSSDMAEVKIKAVASYNTNKQFHPKASKNLGFIVTMDGLSVYHAGDTDLIPEMKGLRCDVALLPVSGTYVMTAGEAVQAAIEIGPKLAVPMHYGEVAGSPADAKRFQDLLKGKVEAKIFKKES